MSAQIFVEGGGNSAQLRGRCREAFANLIKKCGFEGRMPRVIACGGRGKAFDRFKTEIADAGESDFVAMLIDSEDPVTDVERTWDHLQKRDGWAKPREAEDDQVLFMTTSMETWIATDRDALRDRFGSDFNENRLPESRNIEIRTRTDMLNALRRATDNRYKKSDVSFELLGKLNPDTLAEHLPSFRRALRILEEKLRRRSGR